MNEETKFKKVCKETLDNIYSKLDGEEKQFLSYLVNCFNIICEKREQLQNNWNELKKYISAEWYCFDNESVEFEIAKDILNKMQELEQGKDEN